MWRTLKACLLIERSNKSNLYSLLFVAVLIVGFMFYANSERVSNPLVSATAEYQSASSALSKFQVVDVSEEGDGSNIFRNITIQRQAIALKLAALNLDREKYYYKGSLKLIDIREKGYEIERFPIVADLIPSKIHNDRDRLYINSLLETETSYKQDSLAYLPFLLILFSMIGTVWFVFLSFYTSGIMIEDFRHTSILKGYPVRFDKYVIAKSMTKLALIVGFIALIFIISLPLIYFKGLGDTAYPVVVFNGELVVYSIVQYIGMCIINMIVIAVFTMLLSIILNVLLKNMYLTLFIQLILFFMPVLFPSLISVLPYNPFHFLNFNMILEGATLELASPVALTSLQGLLILIVCIGIMLVAIKAFLSTGKLKRV